jgi:hypothetical protein
VELRHRVDLVELPLGAAGSVNAVLVDGDPLTLVDTGVRDPASIARLEATFAARDAKGPPARG